MRKKKVGELGKEECLLDWIKKNKKVEEGHSIISIEELENLQEEHARKYKLSRPLQKSWQKIFKNFRFLKINRVLVAHSPSFDLFHIVKFFQAKSHTIPVGDFTKYHVQ